MVRQLGVAVTGLTKRYGDVVAVDDISFEVDAGSVFAFVGTNGAGKSTTIGCLTTIVRANAGTLTVAGHDVARRRMPCAGRSEWCSRSPCSIRCSPSARTSPSAPGPI